MKRLRGALKVALSGFQFTQFTQGIFKAK